MTWKNLVWKEIRERPTAMLTGLLTITLGVAALVAIRNVTYFSEQAVAKEMEALGFLGSKLLNHKRKCDGPADWKRLTAKKRAGEPKSDKVIVASWALHHFRNERGPKPMPYPLRVLNQETYTRHRTRLAYQLSRDLGALLGHALYRAVMEGHISKTEVKVLFSNPFQGDSAYLLYRKWTRRMDRMGER